ncbi:MAG: hypothetical protein IPP74_14535 [Alphaproteobacteria bacterium]|nr:hypothetical protein [Alphaproteobacteria bacterium]
MSNAPIDQNTRQGLIAVSNADGTTIVPLYADPTTHRLLVDFASAGGTVTSVSVVTANGFAGSVATATTTPAITLSTTVTGILSGNGTAISAASTTGSGDVVLATSPTLVTPLLGTPTSGNLANCTGYPVAGLANLGTGVATALAINVGSAGAFVTFNGALGTPSSGTLTSATGLPISTGVSGLGTGVATALAINVGSAGAFVTFNGALGTPSSGTVTNLTGTASININGTVGGTTPTTATFTTATINTSLLPDANDGAVLGAAGTAFSDLFLAEGGVINWDSSDVTLTQTGNILAVAGGDFRIATADVGTNADSVPTLSSTSTFTSKTLTSPTITTASLSGTQLLAEGASIGLDPSASADGAYSGITMTATSGYAQAFGDLVYLDPTDSRWEACDANSAAGADGDSRGMLGMVVVAGTDGNACTVLLQGVIRADANFPTFTVNNPIYVSETAGDVTQTQPVTTDVVIRFIGAALTADSMYFDPDKIWYTHT